MFRTGFALGLMVLLSGCIGDLTQAPPQPWSAAFSDVAVASDDLVRVVTPFSEPRVVTTSSAEIERSQNVLYVLADGDDPITMFITDAENESSSINVAMTPRPGESREVDLAKMAGRKVEKAANAGVVEKAPSGRTSSIDETAAWLARPCKLCRNQDDEGGNYDSSRW
ncbi:MAG: hypothetical protein ACR2QH_09460 [Geminicoccaceae bacterium]